MTMTSLICGSLAFDSIMSFGSRFADAILADQLHKINVCFFVPDMRREFGGCAGNIAYNLKLLGGDARIMATLGSDGADYLTRLQNQGISTRNIKTIST
jgi:adenosine kinase